MQHTLVIIHSLVRYLILIFGIWAFLRAVMGVSSKSAYGAADAKAGLFFMIFLDVQFLLGLLLMFVSPFVNFKEMSNAVIRFFTMEHTVMAIAAIAFVHIGRAKIKKLTDDAKKHRTALIFFGIALLLIIALIPWPFREALGRGWLPNF